jgi:2,3-dihydroxyphenylpropionate 1,2-dioxygenase
MRALAQCISHSPAMSLRPLRDERGPAVAGALADAQRSLAEFAPQLVVLFTPDHYNGFFYDLMPAFCVGTQASGVGDFGTRAGALDVDGETAYRLHEHLLADGFDAAVSHDMRVDHAVMQLAERILPPGVQTIPVFINCASPPLPPLRRARQIGGSIGRFFASETRRLAYVGSGGLSHDPPFPDIRTAAGEDRERIVVRKTLKPPERAAREARTMALADQFARGEAPIAPINPDWDRQALRRLAAGDWDWLDSLRDAEITAQAGRSAHEIRTWVAALSALGAYGAFRVEQQFYAAAPEWIVGYGALRAATA